MYLKQLKLSNFKNYSDVDVEFCNNVNCLVGNNGVGKTNLLDALYYLSFCKSYFNPVDGQNIRQNQDFFAIHGYYLGLPSAADPCSPVQVSLSLKKGQAKHLKFGGKPVGAFAEHVGRIPLVIITPSDQQLIIGGSDLRRKFVDGIISQVNRSYLQNLLRYQKAVEQRNRLLKTFADDRYFDEPSIEIWDQQLVRSGGMILQERRHFLEDFMPLFNQYFKWIATDTAEQAEISYASTLQGTDADFEQQLKDARQRDALLQYTTVGPHKDDLEFAIGGFGVKKFGSQGQQKTLLLALKLAQFQYINDRVGVKPILLLDDIFDKLDMLRVKRLVQLVGSDRFGQVFLSDTQPGRVEAIFEETPAVTHKIFHVENGTLQCTHEQ